MKHPEVTKTAMDARRARLEQVYSAHPVTAAAVLDRVRRERGSLTGLTARDLAESIQGGVTDQNHIGGAAAVRALAAAAGLQRGWSVLDIGTGLGGTPRLLAEEFGCRCHGVELTSCRFRDAVLLTQTVGLEELVTFTEGDFMTTDIPGSPFDLAIAQGAFMHFSDLHAVLARVAKLLRPAGRLVVEDGVILTPPSTRADKAALEELLHNWNGTFQREEHWRDLLQRTGIHVDQVDDLTAVSVADFEHLLTATEAGRVAGVTAEERRAWQLALRLSHAGHLGTVRIVGTRLPLSSSPDHQF